MKFKIQVTVVREYEVEADSVVAASAMYKSLERQEHPTTLVGQSASGWAIRAISAPRNSVVPFHDPLTSLASWLGFCAECGVVLSLKEAGEPPRSGLGKICDRCAVGRV